MYILHYCAGYFFLALKPLSSSAAYALRPTHCALRHAHCALRLGYLRLALSSLRFAQVLAQAFSYWQAWASLGMS